MALAATALGAAAALPAGRTLLALLTLGGAVVALVVLAAQRPATAVMLAWMLLLLQISFLPRLEATSVRLGNVAGNLDEAVLVLVSGVVLLRAVVTGTPRIPWRLVSAGAAVLLLGLVSALFSEFGPQTLLGAFYGAKFWLLVLLSLAVPWQSRDLERAYRMFVLAGLAVVAVAVVDLVAPEPLRELLATQRRTFAFRASALQSVFPNPGRLSEFMTALFAVTAAHYVVTRRRADLVWAAVFLATAAMSLRLRSAFAPVAVILALSVLRQRGTAGRLLTFAGLIVVTLVAVGPTYLDAVGRQATQFTASSDDTARGLLYARGLDVATDRFPLGSGFGTYGTYAARAYYSDLYVEFGFPYRYGLSPRQDRALTDTSWPAVYAETGYLGLIAFVAGLLALFARARTSARSADRDVATAGTMAACAAAAYTAATLGSPALYDSLSTLTLALPLGLAVGLARSAAPDQWRPPQRRRRPLVSRV